MLELPESDMGTPFGERLRNSITSDRRTSGYGFRIASSGNKTSGWADSIRVDRKYNALHQQSRDQSLMYSPWTLFSFLHRPVWYC